MRMRAEGMERWGVVTILTESARLLHKHWRLFLPFYLAFYLPSSFAAIFQSLFFGPSATPVHYASFIKSAAFTTPQGTDTNGLLVPTIVSTILSLLIFVSAILGMGAVAYIVAYIYSNADSTDKSADCSIVKRIIKLLPHTFLRMFVTELWIVLVFFLLYIVCLIMGGVFYSIISAAAGWNNPPFVVLLALLPFLVSTILFAIVFAFAEIIAVLEPEKYGRAALERSTKLARTGGEGTIVAVLLFNIIVSVILIYVPTQAIVSGTLPLWENIILGILIGVVNSVFSAYGGVVSVVMYFVYNSRFDPANSGSIPEFGSAASIENPYQPLVPGNVYPNTIGEP